MDNAVRRPELLQVADAVAREKALDREEILTAMDEGIARAARARYGAEKDIRAVIDRKTGEVRLSRWTEVVEDAFAVKAEKSSKDGTRAFDEDRMIPLSLAQKIRPGSQVGDFIVDPLPPMEFGRLGAQAAKQAINQRVRETERQRELDAWGDRVGEIVSGTVTRVEFGNIIIDLGRAEAMMKRQETIQREAFQVGDRVRAYLMEVSPQARGQQIFLSRTHPGFLSKLFAAEVPEIYDGVIQIKAVARDPGSRAKIAVISNDPSIDPVGACIGRAGARVRPITEELRGERIDILNWSPEPAHLLVAALAPAEVTKVVIDEGDSKVVVVVPEAQLSLAIGRRGQNVRLASQLTRWSVELTTQEKESERREADTVARSAVFIEALDVDDLIARLLVEEGFVTVQDILDAGVEDLAAVQGFDDELAAEIYRRAEDAIGRDLIKLDERRVALGVSDDIAAFDVLSLTSLVALGEAGVKTLDDLADLAGDELQEILGEDALDLEAANAVVMAARSHWFEGEQAA